MKPIARKTLRRQRRKRRARRRISGTTDRPRLTVFRSHTNIYAQIIDDSVGQTLVAASTMEKPVRGQVAGSEGKIPSARAVGEALAAKAVEVGIRRAVFDRNGYPFHGRVRQLAEAARKGGLDF